MTIKNRLCGECWLSSASGSPICKDELHHQGNLFPVVPAEPGGSRKIRRRRNEEQLDIFSALDDDRVGRHSAALK